MGNDFKDIIGLEAKEWNKALDDYLWNNLAVAETHERMSFRQKEIINEYKKSFKRFESKKLCL